MVPSRHTFNKITTAVVSTVYNYNDQPEAAIIE